MKKTDIESYKQKQIHGDQTPSGMVIKYRDISPYTLLKIQEELKISTVSEDSYSAKLIEKLFEVYLVSPKVPDELELKDLLNEDYRYIHDKIFKSVIFEEEEK